MRTLEILHKSIHIYIFVFIGFVSGFTYGDVIGGFIGVFFTVALYFLFWRWMKIATKIFPEFTSDRAHAGFYLSIVMAAVGMLLSTFLTDEWWFAALGAIVGGSVVFVFVCVAYSLTGKTRSIFVIFAAIAIATLIVFTQYHVDKEARHSTMQRKMKTMYEVSQHVQKTQQEFTQRSSDIQKYYSDALAFLQQQKYQKAIEHFSKIEDDPLNKINFIQKNVRNLEIIARYYFHYACACSKFSETCKEPLLYLQKADKLLSEAENYDITQKIDTAKEPLLKSVLSYRNIILTSTKSIFHLRRIQGYVREKSPTRWLTPGSIWQNRHCYARQSLS